MKALLERVDCRWLEEDALGEFDLERALWNINTQADFSRAAERREEK